MNVETFTRAIMRKISEKGKVYQDFFAHLIWLMLSIPQRVNFSTLSRYGGKSEKTYRNHFSKPHEMSKFNKELIKSSVGSEVFWGFDPSYMSKSGKKTYGTGYFWSGCAASTKWGMEIASICSVDVESRTALHYKAIQTPSKLEKETPWEYYSRIIIESKEELQSISNICIQDAYFCKNTFVSPLLSSGFEVISKFQRNPNLRYLYVGVQVKKPGRPTTYAGKLKLKELDFQYFVPCYQDKNEIGYEAVVYSVALKTKVKVVVIHTLNENGSIKSVRTLFSTNINRLGMDIVLYYHLRFQQEFLFRDAKQFVGLQDCEARSQEKLDFHINACLTAVNVAKLLHGHPQEPFSMADIKTHYFNELLLDETFDLFINEFGIDPNLVKNNPKFAQLYKKGLIAA